MPKKETMEKKQPLDFVLLITVLILLSFGIIMVLSASSPTALSDYRKQLLLCRTTSSFCCYWYISNACNI